MQVVTFRRLSTRTLPFRGLYVQMQVEQKWMAVESNRRCRDVSEIVRGIKFNLQVQTLKNAP